VEKTAMLTLLRSRGHDTSFADVATPGAAGAAAAPAAAR
jgi:hypothetical protein